MQIVSESVPYPSTRKYNNIWRTLFDCSSFSLLHVCLCVPWLHGGGLQSLLAHNVSESV